MARIFTAGNEFGHYGADGFTIYRGPVSDVRNQSGGAVSPFNSQGLWYFYLTNDTGLEKDFSVSHPSGIDEFYVRFHFHPGARTDGSWQSLRFEAGNDALMLRFGTIDGGSGSTNGGNTYFSLFPPTGTATLVNSIDVFKNNMWHLVEMHIKFGASGRIRMWVNRHLQIDYSGSLVGGGGETEMTFFRPDADLITGGAMNYRGFDNIAINDLTGTLNNHRIGPGFVLPMWPVGAGSSSQLTNSFGTSVDNFKFINKPAPSNPSGLVGTSTPGDKDLYALPSIPGNFHGVNALKVAAYAVRNGPAITKAKLIIKPSAQAEIDLPSGIGVGDILPVGALDYINQEFDTNPNTGALFTKAELDGMEAGIQLIA